MLYVAPKSPILDFLETMRSSKIHLGLVVDGVGGVNGLVTIEPHPKKTRQGYGKHSKYSATSRNHKRKAYKGQGR